MRINSPLTIIVIDIMSMIIVGHSVGEGEISGLPV